MRVFGKMCFDSVFSPSKVAHVVGCYFRQERFCQLQRQMDLQDLQVDRYAFRLIGLVGQQITKNI